jgi:hypothetical protein
MNTTGVQAKFTLLFQTWNRSSGRSSADGHGITRTARWRERIVALWKGAFLKPVVQREAGRARSERVRYDKDPVSANVFLHAIRDPRSPVAQSEAYECPFGREEAAHELRLDVNLAAPRDVAWPDP